MQNETDEKCYDQGIKLNSSSSIISHTPLCESNYDAVCFYLQNSNLNKFKFDKFVNYIIKSIVDIRLTSTTNKFYVITDYPKIYKHSIGNDVVTDCTKVMFNKRYKLSVTSDVTDDVIKLINGIEENNIKFNILEGYCSNITNALNSVANLTVENYYYINEFFNFDIVDSKECKNEHDNSNLALSSIYAYANCASFDMLHSNLQNLVSSFEKFNINDFNKNTYDRVKSLLKKCGKINNIYILKNKRCNNIYAKIISKLNLDTVNMKLLDKFSADFNEIDELDESIQESYDEIENTVDELLDLDDEVSDNVNCSDIIFQSFMTMMNWINELDMKGCMGLGTSIKYIQSYKTFDISVYCVPNSCLSVLDSMEIMSEHIALDNINNITITVDPYNKSSINAIMPLYINETHWTMSKNYLKIASGLIKNCYPFVNDSRYWDIYYVFFTKYIDKMYKDLSDNEVILFCAYWKTIIEITKHEKINCKNIFKRSHEKNYKHFDYVCLMGQILSSDNELISVKDMISTIYYYVKQLSWEFWRYNDAGCDFKNELNGSTEFIVNIIKFFMNVQNHKEHINTIMNNMDELNSVVNDCTIKLIKEFFSKNTEEGYNYINDFMKSEFHEYSIIDELKLCEGVDFSSGWETIKNNKPTKKNEHLVHGW